MTPAESCRIERPVWARGRNLITAVAAAGILASAAGWASDPKQFYASYLVAYVSFTLLALGATFFVMLQHVTGSVWSVTLRPMMENVMVTVPLAAPLFVPVALGIPVLYDWSHPGFSRVFFSPVFYTVRMLFYFAVWSVLAVALYRYSKRPDRAVRWSAPGLVALVITVTMASVDWLMSLEPHWYSTIFGVYVFSGGMLAFVALLTLMLLGFRRAVTVEQYHDLGKWLFTLTMWWAYIAFSQYLLIWYANLPEETVWFQHRFEGNWIYMSGTLLFGRFLLPFAALMARAPKRNLIFLGGISIWMLLMHFMEVHWIVMPTVHRHGFHLHWLDLATLAAVGGVFALVFWWWLRPEPNR